jgi:hypothetical protein
MLENIFLRLAALVTLIYQRWSEGIRENLENNNTDRVILGLFKSLFSI